MTDRVTNSDLLAPDTVGVADLVQPALDGSETIELAFTATELDEFLRDPAMHGDLADWLVHAAPTPAAHPQSPAVADVDRLLAALGDDLPQWNGEDLLEAATRLGKPLAGGDGRTFLLTEVDIGDLLGDFEQARDVGLGSESAGLGSETELLDTFVNQPVTLHIGGHSLVVVEIEDETSLTSAHILS